MSTLGSDNAYRGGITYSTPAFIFGNTGSINGGYNFDLPLATVAAFNSQGLDFLAANSANARGFFQTIEKSATEGVNRSERASLGLVSQGLRASQGLARFSIESQERINYLTQIESTKRVEKMPKADSGWCFITTAVCEAENLPDDCEPLQKLRQFRDGFMRESDELKNAVSHYYQIAPTIVKKLKAFPDGGKFAFAYLKTNYIDPAIEAIDRGDNDTAFTLYASMVDFASDMVA